MPADEQVRLMMQMLSMACPHCGMKLTAHTIEGEVAKCPDPIPMLAAGERQSKEQESK